MSSPFARIGSEHTTTSMIEGLYCAVEEDPTTTYLLATQTVIRLSPEKTIRKAKKTDAQFPTNPLVIADSDGKPCLPCFQRTALPVNIISGSERPEQKRFYVTTGSLQNVTGQKIPFGFHRESDEERLATEVTDFVHTFLNISYGERTEEAIRLYKRTASGEERVC